MSSKLIYPGQHVEVNGNCGLGLLFKARPFIGQPCVVIKICKSGLVQVHLALSPKQTISVPQLNITTPPST